MAYYGCSPKWAPDYVEAARAGGKSVQEQIEEEKVRWAADPENPDAVHGPLAPAAVAMRSGEGMPPAAKK